MLEIKTRAEAIQLMEAFDANPPEGQAFGQQLDCLEAFFLTDEQKAEMENAQEKYAVQIGIDPDFARFFYGVRRKASE